MIPKLILLYLDILLRYRLDKIKFRVGMLIHVKRSLFVSGFCWCWHSYPCYRLKRSSEPVYRRRIPQRLWQRCWSIPGSCEIRWSRFTSTGQFMGQSLCWGKKIDQIVNFRDILDFDEAFKLLKWYWSSCRILFFSTYKTLFHNIWDILMFLCLLPIWGWAPNALRNVFVKEKLLLYF